MSFWDKPLRILITGGTGSLGTALVERWHSRHRLTVLSRNPHNQKKLRDEHPDLRYVLADVRDVQAVRDACRGQDVLVHAAALKDVHVGTYYPREYMSVNCLGSRTVADAWWETHDSPWGIALLISTDKAVRPVNFYGGTKMVATGLFREYGYSVLRYGNVVESRGSFLDRWRMAIDSGQPLEVRTPDPTRFFVRMHRAVDMVEAVLGHLLQGGENYVFVPRSLKAFSIADVARSLGAKTVEVPLLSYEKQHEVLVAHGDGEIAVGLGSSELAMVRPGWEGGDPPEPYCSATAPRMTGEEFLREVKWRR